MAKNKLVRPFDETVLQKIKDAETNPYYRAMRDTVQSLESGSIDRSNPDANYNLLVGGATRIPDEDMTGQHPGHDERYRRTFVNPRTGKSDYSTAMGLYQITRGTWDEFAPQVGATDPKNPDHQRLVYGAILNNTGAFDNVLSGDIEGAMGKMGKRWEAIKPSGKGRDKFDQHWNTNFSFQNDGVAPNTPVHRMDTEVVTARRPSNIRERIAQQMAVPRLALSNGPLTEDRFREMSRVLFQPQVGDTSVMGPTAAVPEEGAAALRSPVAMQAIADQDMDHLNPAPSYSNDPQGTMAQNLSSMVILDQPHEEQPDALAQEQARLMGIQQQLSDATSQTYQFGDMQNSDFMNYDAYVRQLLKRVAALSYEV